MYVCMYTRAGHMTRVIVGYVCWHSIADTDEQYTTNPMIELPWEKEMEVISPQLQNKRR